MALTAAFTARPQADSLTVTGVVVNTVDGKVLPMCHVQLLQEERSMGIALTGNDGHFTLPPLAAGGYNLLITQFGDTMLHYKNLSLTRDTRIRSIVLPPSDNVVRVSYFANTSKMVWLNTVNISGTRNLLYKMGLLITSPNDPRLWNLSGRMGSPAPASIATPLDEDGNYDSSLCGMPETLKQFLTFGRKLYLTPPIWVLCNEPWNPVPVAQKESEKSEDNNEERSQEDNN